MRARDRQPGGSASPETEQAAAPPADRVGTLQDLQALAGNGAVARLIGGGALARQPQLTVYDTTQTSQLHTAFSEALTAAIGPAGSGDIMALVKDLVARVHALHGNLATDQGVEKQIATLADVKSTVSGATYDLASTGVALREALAGEDGVAYAPAFYVSQLATFAGFYLAAPLGDPDAITLAQLTAKLDELVQALGQRVTLLSLELDASVNHLVGLRSEISLATTDEARKSKRAEVAEAARRALLLDRAISGARKSEDPNAPGPLTEVLGSVQGTVAAIRANEATEAKTRKALGDQTSLLGPQALENTGVFDEVAAQAKPVEPEEALPAATAGASDVFVGSLASHLEDQQKVLSPDAAKGNVVPTGNSIEDLKLAHSRYMAFVSQHAADPVREESLFWFETMYEIYGHMGLEGGAGRALLMHTGQDLVAGGVAAPSLDFASQIQSTKRRTAVSGTAGSVDYDTAELFQGADEGVGRGAESASRTKYGAATSQHQREQFDRAIMDSAAGDYAGMRADIGVKDEALYFAPDQIKGTWSYLVRSENPLTGQKVAEQKQMPMEVANLILERTQALSALQGTHQTGGLGEGGTRTGGVEGTKGTVREQYLQGKETPPDAKHPGLKSVEEAKAQAASAPNAKMPPGKAATASVLADLEHYLDGWFANAQGVVPRVSGVLALANREYGVAEQIAHELTGAKLAIAVAKALALAAAIRLAGMFGPIGRALGEAVGKVMHHLGAPDAAIVLTIAGWIHAAGEVENLGAARAQAYMVQHVAADMVMLFENAVSNVGVAGMNVGWTALTSGKKPNTVGDLIRELGPVLENSAAKEEFLKSIEAEIAVREGTQALTRGYDPELAPLRSLRDAIKGVETKDTLDPDSVLLEAPGPAPGGGGPQSTGGSAVSATPPGVPAIEQAVSDARAGRAGKDAFIDRYGSWEGAIERLKSGADELATVPVPERQELIKQLVAHRQEVIGELRGMYEAQEIEGASAEPGSDVDLNMTGPDAGRHAAEAMTYLDAARPGWRTRYRMGILVDAGRAETLSEALGKLPTPDRLEVTRRQAMAAEAFLVAREARDAETPAARDKLLEGISDEGLRERARWLASLDESAANSERLKLLAHSDTALKAIDPKGSVSDRKAQIGEALDTQALANALDSEAYVTSGGIRSVVLGKAVDVTGRYEAVIDQISMLHHQAHAAPGGMRGALRRYETWKYVLRICDQLTAAGIKDPRIAFLRNQGELVYKVDRSAVSSDAPRDVTAGGATGKASVAYEDTGEVPGVTNEFLAETHGMLQGLVDDHLSLLRKQALGPGVKATDAVPVKLPELGPPEPVQPQSSGATPVTGPAPGGPRFWESGLTDPNTVVRVADALTRGRVPAGATLEVHAKTALAPMASELARVGTKPPQVQVTDLGDPVRWGYFDQVQNVIVVNEKAGLPDGRLALDVSDPAGRQRLDALIFHESRHAEQYFQAIRYIIATNPLATPTTGIHPDIVAAAANRPLLPGAPEAEVGRRAYDEFFGAQNPWMQWGQDSARTQFLRNQIELTTTARDLARVELQKVKWFEMTKKRVATQKIERLQKDMLTLQAELDSRTQTYNNLFHEWDAYTAQAKLEQAMPEARLKEAERQVHETLDVLFHIREVMPDAETEALQSAGVAMQTYWEALEQVARLARPGPGAPAPAPATTGAKKP